MKNVKLLSLGFVMLISFGLKAQEKPVSKEQSEQDAKAIKSETIAKSKDTISNRIVSTNAIKPATSSPRVIICAVSRSITNEPLYILDGFLINSKQFSKINPNTIENVKVLKGIEATALYGSRASNGVIVITTKEED